MLPNEIANAANVLDEDISDASVNQGSNAFTSAQRVVPPRFGAFGAQPTVGSKSAPSPTVIKPTEGVNYTSSQNANVLGNAPIDNVSDSQDEASITNTSDREANKEEKKELSKASTKTKLWLIGICVGAVALVVVLIMGKQSGGLDSLFSGEESDSTAITPDVKEWVEVVDPFMDGIAEDEWIVDIFNYDEDQLLKLRSLGYTADDIEAARNEKTPFEDLVKSAEEARKKYLEETVKPYYEARSDEFKQAEADTWLGLPAQDADDIVAAHNIVFQNGLASYQNTKTINTDYEKVNPRGSQLFLKVYLNKDHTDWIYYECSLTEFCMLEQKGNLVVELQSTDVTDKAGSVLYHNATILSITIY